MMSRENDGVSSESCSVSETMLAYIQHCFSKLTRRAFWLCTFIRNHYHQHANVIPESLCHYTTSDSDSPFWQVV